MMPSYARFDAVVAFARVCGWSYISKCMSPWLLPCVFLVWSYNSKCTH